MEWLRDIMNSGGAPVISAFLLGLAVSLHPCPLATNVAAMGYIAKDMGRGRRLMASGLLYTLGRVLAYTVLGVALTAVFRSGTDVLALGDKFGEWGEKLLSPVLIIVGLYFLLSKFLHRHEHCAAVPGGGRRFGGLSGSLALGVLLALSFCPESAIVYFGVLIPMSSEASAGWLLPLVFSLGTAIPTVVLAWIVAYGVSGWSASERLAALTREWMGLVMGLLFIGAGVFCALV